MKVLNNIIMGGSTHSVRAPPNSSLSGPPISWAGLLSPVNIGLSSDTKRSIDHLYNPNHLKAINPQIPTMVKKEWCLFIFMTIFSSESTTFRKDDIIIHTHTSRPIDDQLGPFFFGKAPHEKLFFKKEAQPNPKSNKRKKKLDEKAKEENVEKPSTTLY